MTFEEYVCAVDEGNWPDDPRVPLDEPVVNENGVIRNIAFGNFGGLAIIESKLQSIRSNHYHKTDSHYIVVLEGHVHYYWRNEGSRVYPNAHIFDKGQVFFTPPMIEHAVYSPEGSVIAALSYLSRRHQNHERDVVRVKLAEVVNGEVVLFR